MLRLAVIILGLVWSGLAWAGGASPPPPPQITNCTVVPGNTVVGYNSIGAPLTCNNFTGSPLNPSSIFGTDGSAVPFDVPPGNGFAIDGTVLNSRAPITIVTTNTSPAIATDLDKVFAANGAGALTFSLPTPVGNQGKSFSFVDYAGFGYTLQTLVAGTFKGTSFISGNTAIIPPSTPTQVVSDNANWLLVVGGSGAAIDTVATGLSAAGIDQATCTNLSAGQNYVATVASGTGVCLPVPLVGIHNYVCAEGANPLTIYAKAGGATINGAASTAGVVLTAGNCGQFIGKTASAWRSIP